MQSREIRRVFTEFFAERRHVELPSSSLIPHNDPTVLLTTAGMQQMTPFFLGLETPPAARMTSIQKCFRTVDIDEVGDESHCTFFEMLGNFSVGDYYKRDAIRMAWELLTIHLGIDPLRLRVTVFPDDEEARQLWQTEVGLTLDRISDDPSNIWGPVGESGPCGPDSEIYFDRGPEFGCGEPDCGPNCPRCDRWLEIWNLVFMGLYHEADGTRRELERKNIDTGMGLERISLAMQGVASIYDTDLYQPIIARAAEIAKTTYKSDETRDRSLRVIGDHGRAVTFLIADGVLPSNEGRGYVLRRILRRAVRHGRLLGIGGPFLNEIAEVVIGTFGEFHPELATRRETIRRVIQNEEEAFGRTLATGIARFEDVAQQAVAQWVSRRNAEHDDARDVAVSELIGAVREYVEQRGREVRALESGSATIVALRDYVQQQAGAEVHVHLPDGPVISGAEAFRLYDTSGFPLELTQELAHDAGMSVDVQGFAEALEQSRARSRASVQAFADAARGRTHLYARAGSAPVAFRGYDAERLSATIADIFGQDAAVEQLDAGEPGEVVLDETVFYGESGGQVGDRGTLATDTGVFQVLDTQRPTPTLVVHRGEVIEGFIRVGQRAEATIDAERRAAIRRNHTATHVLHAALREVLGSDTHQAGSLVAPDRLRFDFTATAALGQDGLRRVSEIANSMALRDLAVDAETMPYADAVELGAMALFGEKYGDVVRVISVGDWSRELCGGTHVRHTGEIGPIVVLSEASIGSGVRRVEALTGEAAHDYLGRLHLLAGDLSRQLHVSVEGIADEVRALQAQLRERERTIEQLRLQLATANIDGLVERAMDVGGVRTLATRVPADSRDALLQIGDRLRDKLGSGVLVLASEIEGQPALLAMVTKDLTARGLSAGRLIQDIAPIVGGRGGGRPEVAQGGGTDATQIDAALAAVGASIERQAAG